MTDPGKSRGWRQEGKRFIYRPPAQDVWDRLRPALRLGQRFSGTVVWVPQPGSIGIGVNLGLAVGGFVDVLLLPKDVTRWPAEGTITDFAIWWLDERPQIRLVPVDERYRREDFTDWLIRQHSPAAEAFRTHL